jgi:hypothetical protein
MPLLLNIIILNVLHVDVCSYTCRQSKHLAQHFKHISWYALTRKAPVHSFKQNSVEVRCASVKLAHRLRVRPPRHNRLLPSPRHST